jgi:hypothetical protein
MQTTAWHHLLPITELSMSMRFKEKLKTSPFEYQYGRPPPINCDSDTKLKAFIGLLVESEMTPAGKRVKLGTYYRGLTPEELQHIEDRRAKTREIVEEHPQHARAVKKLKVIMKELDDISPQFNLHSKDHKKLGEPSLM